jgi:hypothetical protein
VICTWTGPQRVCAAEPVYVLVVPEPLLFELELREFVPPELELLDDGLLPAEPAAGLRALLETVAVEVLLVEVW